MCELTSTWFITQISCFNYSRGLQGVLYIPGYYIPHSV